MSSPPMAEVEQGSIDRGGRQLRWTEPRSARDRRGAGGVDYCGPPWETQLAAPNTVITYVRAGVFHRAVAALLVGLHRVMDDAGEQVHR